MNSILEIAKAGLNRFYDEGFTQWPEEKLKVVFSNQNLEGEEIQAVLKRWHAAGFIELPRQKHEYLKMLGIIAN